MASNAWLVLLCLVAYVACSVREYANDIDSSPNTSYISQSRRLEISANRPKCMIVAYDKIKGHLNWMQDWFLKAAKERCRLEVTLTDSKGMLGSADIILYHAPTHTISGSLRNANNKALIAMMSMEQPKYSPVLANLKYLDANVDLMLTYSLASVYPGTNVANMPITYWPLNIVSPQAVLQPARPFAEKTGYGTGVMVAVFASNCKKAGAQERSRYLEDLMRHIPVHSYGTCLHNRDEPSAVEIPDDPRWPPIAQRRARKIKVLSHYKFYLAFENAPIEDYVSEKVFEGLIAGTVPVYRGAPTIHKFMPANSSYINANDLSPKDLAQLLLSVGREENSYNAYLAFKKEPLSQTFQDMALMSYTHPNVLCRLCEHKL